MTNHFTPKHQKSVQTERNVPQLLYLAHQTALQQGYAIAELHRGGFLAVSQNGLLSWNHQLLVTVRQGEL